MIGTIAAWAQRAFFGGAIPAGSWFSILQRLSMTLTSSSVERLAANVGLAVLSGFARRERKAVEGLSTSIRPNILTIANLSVSVSSFL